MFSPVGPRIFFPTFTYPINTPFPRAYKNKRTPAWPDRILWRGRNGDRLVATRSIREVVCSDHEPITATVVCSAVRAQKAAPQKPLTVFWYWYHLAFGVLGAMTTAAAIAFLVARSRIDTRS